MLKVNLNYIKFVKTQEALLLNNNFILSSKNIYTIIGKNGSGKSTLLLAIVKMLNENEFFIDGSVEFENNNLYSLNDKKLSEFRAENFRFVFQDPVSAFNPLKKMQYYFDLTSTSIKEIKTELKYFQLQKYSEIKNLYPHELSIGMLQRINIILALISHPKILLLDEPTSALDLPIINLLKNRLKEYTSSDNRIVLLVTQDIPFAKNTCNYIAKLVKGKLSDFLPNDKYFETNEI